MRLRWSFPVVVLALVAAPCPVLSQDSSGREDEVLAVVDRLFDGMRAADSSLVRSILHPDLRLVTVGEGEGGPTLRSEPMDGFVTAVGTPHEEVWDERIWDPEVRIDGRLATVWVSYAFYAGEEFSHCGVDAFQLFEGSEGWKIFQIVDTRRREGCEVPGEVSPG